MLQSASADTKKATARGNSQPKTAPAGLQAPPVPAWSNRAELHLQRKCDCGGGPDCDCDMGHDNKKKDSPRTGLHRAAAGPGGPEIAPPIVREVLRSPGQTLDAETRAFFESRFSRDFSGVRIHTDSRAAQSARAVNAHAYTVGNNIAFAPGRFAPTANEGRRLLAHELTHTLQQSQSPNSAGLQQQTKLSVGAPSDSYEREADQAADQIMRMAIPSAPLPQQQSGSNRQLSAPQNDAPPQSGRQTASPLVHGERSAPGLSQIHAPRIQRETPPAPAPAPYTPTVNLALKPITDAHPTVTPAQTKALQALDANVTGVWTHLDWPTLSAGAAVRVFNPEKIDQTVLGLCGPAAAINGEALQAPDSYAQLVVSVFQTGKIGTKSVNDTLKAGTPPAGMDQSDWMLMSALQDVNNAVYDYYGKQPDPGEKDKRASQPTGQVEDDLKKTGCVATTTYKCFVFGEMGAAEKANKLLQDHPADVDVIIFLSSGLLVRKEGATSTPDHFIRLLKAMAINEVNVKFDAFTWGSNRSFDFTVAEFKKLVSAFIVGTRSKDVSL